MINVSGHLRNERRVTGFADDLLCPFLGIKTQYELGIILIP